MVCMQKPISPFLKILKWNHYHILQNNKNNNFKMTYCSLHIKVQFWHYFLVFPLFFLIYKHKYLHLTLMDVMVYANKLSKLSHIFKIYWRNFMETTKFITMHKNLFKIQYSTWQKLNYSTNIIYYYILKTEKKRHEQKSWGWGALSFPPISFSLDIISYTKSTHLVTLWFHKEKQAIQTDK